MRPKCFNEKNQHNGDYLVELESYRADVIADVDHVVSWCPECGAIVIDNVIDGRLMRAHVKMRWPKITRKELGR